MKIDTRLFRSILARRFFVLFVLSALVPTAILAVVAYPYVSDQLFAQSSERLWRTAKSESLSSYAAAQASRPNAATGAST